MAALGWGQGHICLWAVEARGPWCLDSGELSSALSPQARSTKIQRSSGIHRETKKDETQREMSTVAHTLQTLHPLSEEKSKVPGAVFSLHILDKKNKTKPTIKRAKFSRDKDGF